jgi:hypothetical protein
MEVGFTFTIVQDRHNVSLLNEIKAYFNDKGGVYNIGKECNIYKVGSKSDLKSVILPKMVNKESMESINDSTKEELKLPLLKSNKIYYACKIIEYCLGGNKLNKETGPSRGEGHVSSLRPETLNEIIRLSYYVSRESDNITLEEYVKELNRK